MNIIVLEEMTMPIHFEGSAIAFMWASKAIQAFWMLPIVLPMVKDCSGDSNHYFPIKL